MPAYADSKQHYTPAEVAAVTGAPVETQNQRHARRVYQSSRRDSIPTGSGDTRLMAVETVYHIGITETCAKLNLPARHGAKAAHLFSKEQPGRAANTPFEFGATLLVMKSTGAEIVNAPFNSSLTEICGRQFEAAVIVDVGQIVRAVNKELKELISKRKSK
jgi:hypothetical protein